MENSFSNRQVEIYTTWTIANEKCINNAVYLVKESDKIDVEDVVSAETCILVQCPEEHSETLSLAFKAPVHMLISRVSVISEARHIETYDHRGEYLSTVRSFLLDDADEDFIAYRSEVKFDNPLREFRIKFLSLRIPHKMWFYGAVLHISDGAKEVLPCSSLGPSVNVGNLITKLEEEGHALSGGAKNLAKLLQTSSINMHPSLPMLLSLLGHKNDASEQNKLIPDEKENTTISSYCHSNKPTEVKPVQQRENVGNESIQLQMQAVVKESEDRLWSRLKKHLEEQERRQNEKLDRILSLLASKSEGSFKD